MCEFFANITGPSELRNPPMLVFSLKCLRFEKYIFRPSDGPEYLFSSAKAIGQKQD